MEKSKSELYLIIYQALQKLIGLHRQLLDNVRMEKKALLDADVKEIQDATTAKQGLIEAIYHAEMQRQKAVAELGVVIKRPFSELVMSQLIHVIQATDLKLADQFRVAQSALGLLLQRIVDQNGDNRTLVEKSLAHVNEMKKNVFGEATTKANTYNQQGQKTGASPGARMISREA